MIKEWIGVGLILLFIAIVVMVVAAQPSVGDAGGMVIRVWHDDARAVTCWIADGSGKGGIACLPDSQIRQ